MCRVELPTIDAVASDYLDSIRVIAVAGYGELAATEERAAELLTDNVSWGFDQSLWDAFGVYGQPTSFMISGDDIVVDAWSGMKGEKQLRQKFDELAALVP